MDLWDSGWDWASSSCCRWWRVDHDGDADEDDYDGDDDGDYDDYDDDYVGDSDDDDYDVGYDGDDVVGDPRTAAGGGRV